MNTAPRITLTHRNGRLFFCVAGVICVKSWPAAVRILKEIQQ
jgi:hypothetical protein